MQSPLPGWATLRAHRSPVRTLGFAPSGLRLLSGDDEGWVVLWSLETRRPVAIWEAHTNALLATLFWDDDLVVTHGRDNKLRIWRVNTSQAYNTSPIPTESTVGVEPASTSPSSRRDITPAASSIGEQYPKPWLVHAQDVNALNFCPVAIAPDSRLFAVPATIASEKIDIYRLSPDFELSRPYSALTATDAVPVETQLDDEANATSRRGQFGTVMSLAFTRTQLIAGYESGQLAVFELSSGLVQFAVQAHKSPVLSLAVHDSMVWSTAADKTIVAMDPHLRRLTTAAKLVRKGTASIDFDTTLNLAVTAGWDGKVRMFSIEEDQLRENAAFPGGRQSGVTQARIAAPDASALTKRRLRQPPAAWIAVAGKDGRVGLYSVPHSLALVSKPDTH